jgi:polyhydroxybutyrate depolymerase
MFHQVQDLVKKTWKNSISCILIVLIFMFLAPCIIYSQITTTHSFFHDGHMRYYKVRHPQNTPPNMPVVFSLPGYNETAQWLIDYIGMDNVADTAGFIVVYPEPIQPGFNSGIIHRPTPNVDDVGFITELIDTVYARYNIDRTRVYCCGYSNGGHMTQRLAYWAGHRFAAVGSICGTMTDCTAVHPPPVARSMPFLILNGTADTFVIWEGGVPGMYAVEPMLDFWVQNNNCALNADTISLPDLDPNDGCTVEKISYTDCSDSVQILFYKIINGGHHWPGALYDWGDGNLNMDINANVEMWNFFKNYTIPDSILDIENNHNNKPAAFSLLQNYPNPFNPSTTIKYTLSKTEKVKIDVFNLLGQKITTLLNKQMPSGTHEVEFTAKDLPSGVYLYKIKAGKYQEVKKMVLLR